MEWEYTEYQPPKRTSQLPTPSGWYWLGTSDNEIAEIVPVFLAERGDGQMGLFCRLSSGSCALARVADKIGHHGCSVWWAGPLPQPEQADSDNSGS